MPTTFVAAVRVQTSILRNAKSWKFLRDVTQFTSPSHTDTQSHTNAHILVSERGACFFLHHDRYALFALHTFLRTHWRVVFHCVLFFVKLSLWFFLFFPSFFFCNFNCYIFVAFVFMVRSVLFQLTSAARNFNKQIVCWILLPEVCNGLHGGNECKK